MLVALELVAMKVDLDTRRKVKILAAERGIEMWELVMELVNREWEGLSEKLTSKKQPSVD